MHHSQLKEYNQTMKTDSDSEVLSNNCIDQGVEPNLNPNKPFHFGEPEPAKFYFSEPEPNLNPQNCAQVNPNRT